jgi:hypothetical protein
VEANRDFFEERNAEHIEELERENRELRDALHVLKSRRLDQTRTSEDQTSLVPELCTRENLDTSEAIMAHNVVQRCKRRLREFIDRPGNKEFHYDNERAELESLLSKVPLTERDLNTININLMQIGTWRIRTGGLAILERKEEAWAEFHLGMTLKAFEVRTFYFGVMRRAPGDRGSTLGVDCALVLAHAMAIGDQTMATELGDLMTQAVARGVYGDYNEHGYEPFVVNLFQDSRGEERRNIGFAPAASGDKYEGVWKSWNSVDDLSKECDTLCNTHLDIAIDKTGDSYSQFGIDPCDIYPAEILALQRIRKKLGLPVPTCDHDLMKSPLADAPTEPPQSTDDLAERIRARLRTEYPGF